MIDWWVDFVWRAKTVVIPLLLVMLVAVILALTGHLVAGQWVAQLGSLGTMLGNLIYIYFVDVRRNKT